MLRLIVIGVILLGGWAATPPTAQAVRIVDFSSARHDRFYAGPDRAFLAEAYDFSGVGYNKPNDGAPRGTLISDRHFLAAGHAHANNTLTFYTSNDPNGPAYTYPVAGGDRIGQTDLWLGKLADPIDPAHNIRPYSIPWLGGEPDAYAGLELLNYGKRGRVGRNIVDGIATLQKDQFGPIGEPTDFLVFDYDNSPRDPRTGGDESYLRPGDSGGPSFTVIDGELTLIGIHSFIYRIDETGERGSGDGFIPGYVEEIEALMADEEDDLSLATPAIRSVPEPGVVLSALLPLIGWFVAGRVRGLRPRGTRWHGPLDPAPANPQAVASRRAD
jgi:hypothetical protein